MTSHGAKQLDYFSTLVEGMDVWTVVAVTAMVGFIILLACVCIHQRRVIHCKSSAVVHSIYKVFYSPNEGLKNLPRFFKSIFIKSVCVVFWSFAKMYIQYIFQFAQQHHAYILVNPIYKFVDHKMACWCHVIWFNAGGCLRCTCS